MRKKFNYEFEDESKQSKISFEYGEENEEKLAIQIEDGVAVLYGNKMAFLLLAKSFIKLSLGNYSNGFHFHINTDFDADKNEAVRVVLDNPEK